MKYAILFFLIISSAVLALEPLCVNWLPVYICPNDTFEMDICRDTLHPGYEYDEIYVYSELADLNPSLPGSWTFDISIDPPPQIPFILNAAYIGPTDWVFGWDSLYIRADTAGVMAAETTIWVFNYPPDSLWYDGLEICPLQSKAIYGKWLEVRGAFFWSWQYDSIIINNDFPHREIIDTTVCIDVDHHIYTAPDSFSDPTPGVIDSALDPCADPICTTMTLLPTDIVDDGDFIVCNGTCDTIVVPVYYNYTRNWISDTFSVNYISSYYNSIDYYDSLEICSNSCGTSYVYVEISDSICGSYIIDSIAVFTPCIDYEILTCIPLPACHGDTLELTLGGELCDGFDSSSVCWTLPDDIVCSISAELIADTSLWVYVDFQDCWGCNLSDSIFIDVYPRAAIDITLEGGCAGDSVVFNATNPGSIAVESLYVEYGDGGWDCFAIDSFPREFSHNYGSLGEFIFRYWYFSEYGCSEMDSLQIRQSQVIAELEASPSPVCLGEDILLDASSSSVDPLYTLTYEFLSPGSDTTIVDSLGDTVDVVAYDTLCGPSVTPLCEFTIEEGGNYRVVVTDGFCYDTAAVFIPVVWAEIDSMENQCAVLGCTRCFDLSATAYYCSGEINYGYRYAIDDSTWSGFISLESSTLCSPIVEDTVSIRAYSWCDDCPESKDSTEFSILPVEISGTASDTIICYGDLMPSTLDFSSLIIDSSICDIACQVTFEYEASGVLHEDILMSWRSITAIPSSHFGYAVTHNGILKYNFALWDDTSCAFNISSRVTIHHPVAVLDILPERICEDYAEPITLDASGSYTNCHDIDLCYAYYQEISGVLVPIYPSGGIVTGCCTTGCEMYSFMDTYDPGSYTFATIICMGDTFDAFNPWCCDTAYQTLEVCEKLTPEIVVAPLCAPDTVLGGTNVTFTVINSLDFEDYLWNNDCPPVPPYLGTDSEITIDIPRDVSEYIACVQAFNCDYACSSCVCETITVIQPIEAISCGPFTGYEDSLFAADLNGCISNPSGIPYEFVYHSGPFGLDIQPDGSMLWDTPDNCDVGLHSVIAEAISESPCEESCTLNVIVEILNTFQGVLGVDSLFGTSCIETPVFTRLSARQATLDMVGTGGFCHNMSLRLEADDQDECTCGFTTDGLLYWFHIDSLTGVITVDHSLIPSGNYTTDVYYSDCSETDTIAVSLDIPNHNPTYMSTVHEIWIPDGYDTFAVSLSDFSDIDGDSLYFSDIEIADSTHYDRLENLGGTIYIRAENGFNNFGDIPDTLKMKVYDEVGNYIQVSLLVWVYDHDKIEVVDRVPLTTGLSGAYPNPFNEAIWIEAQFADKSEAMLMIYDISGHLVRQVFEGTVPAGEYRFRWDGTTMNSGRAPSGVYFGLLQANGRRFVKSITLVR